MLWRSTLARSRLAAPDTLGSTTPAARGEWRRWRLARRKRLQSMGLGQPGRSPVWRRKVAAKTSTVPHQSRSAPVWDRNEPSDSSDLFTGLFPLHCWLNMHGVAALHDLVRSMNST